MCLRLEIKQALVVFFLFCVIMCLLSVEKTILKITRHKKSCTDSSLELGTKINWVEKLLQYLQTSKWKKSLINQKKGRKMKICNIPEEKLGPKPNAQMDQQHWHRAMFYSQWRIFFSCIFKVGVTSAFTKHLLQNKWAQSNAFINKLYVFKFFLYI